MSEPLLQDNPNRFCLFPIKYFDVWEAYKKHKSSFWTAEEIDFSADKDDWNKLNENEKYFIEHILAFFAGSDGIVLENLVTNFCREIPIPEVRCFYGFQAMMENIHCVVGHTKILTDNGYYMIMDLVDKNVNVWNGTEYSNVMVKYTGHQSIYKVNLSNGMYLECSPGHKWLLQEGNHLHPESCKIIKQETISLKEGDILAKYNICFQEFQDPNEFLNPYIHGFFCGDGTYCNKYPMIYLYGEKKKLLSHFKFDSLQYNRNSIRFFITKFINKSKYEVPINYSKDVRLRWLEGLVDADGCVNKKDDDYTSIQLSSINKHFLIDVQLLLTTLGILTHIKLSIKAGKKMLPKNDGSGEQFLYECKDCYVLYISGKSVNDLILLGFSPKRLEIKYCKRLDDAIEKDKRIKVISIEKISENEATYCFNEPKNHTGIFNGILTGQSEVYSLLIDTYVTDHHRRLQLYNAIEEIPCVKQKAVWALKYIHPKNSFAQRLVAFGIVEGLFFSGAFCAIFWLKERGLMTKSLGKSNEWICRDEGLHTDFAVLLYKYVENKLTQDEINEMMMNAVQIEEDFICNSLPCRLLGMNQDLMKNYIRFVADRLLMQFGYFKIYNTPNPFPFMNKISLEGKTNFFEQRVTEYVLTSSLSENADIKFDISHLDSDIF